MPSKPKRIEVQLETRLDSVALAEDICQSLAKAAGFDDGDCHKISVSVREAVVNAFRHGNEEQCQKTIRMSVEVASGKFIVHVLDQGQGFDLCDVPDPRTDENIFKPSGRGIFLMRTFMDEFDVRRSAEGGAELVMAKRLPWPLKRTGRRTA